MQNSFLTGLNILIVEDEPLLRKQMAAYLEKLGADVMSAGTLEGAKKLVAEPMLLPSKKPNPCCRSR